MRLGIKGKQVLGVTSIVGTVVVVLSVMHLSRLVFVSLDESRARAELVADAIYQRAFEVVGESRDPYEGLRSGPGMRTMLEASLYSKNVTYAAIVNPAGVVVRASHHDLEGEQLPPATDLVDVLRRSWIAQLNAVYRGRGRNLEIHIPLLVANKDLGSIRVGVSTLLIRSDLNESLRPVIVSALLALAVSIVVAMLLAQLLLRPIHVIRSGLTRLGQGEFGVRLDLDQKDEFGELGNFFNTVSAQLSADRSQMAGQVANLESAVEHLEDAVAIVNPQGELMFANPAMRALWPTAAPGAPLDSLLPRDHALSKLVGQTLVARQSRGPLSAPFGDAGDRLVMTHAVNDPKGDLVGVMLVARNVDYLSQVQSTIRYSRKLAALGRLSAGVAHEVKNPLNAMMIHLELLRQKVAARAPAESRVSIATLDGDDAAQHVDIIAHEIKRLDEVMQGFLKFSRPEDLKLQPVQLASLLDEVVRIAQPEADRTGVQVIAECDDAPDVNGDPAMLRQAFLNLALNACQAMPTGGTLRISSSAARDRRVLIRFADSGLGVKPDHLEKIFNLYFTTKEKGTGIGLSMVYRTVQMHDGEIEVQSTLGKGTTFTILLPQT
jgi:signal transduction histidine kinase